MANGQDAAKDPWPILPVPLKQSNQNQEGQTSDLDRHDPDGHAVNSHANAGAPATLIAPQKDLETQTSGVIEQESKVERRQSQIAKPHDSEPTAKRRKHRTKAPAQRARSSSRNTVQPAVLPRRTKVAVIMMTVIITVAMAAIFFILISSHSTQAQRGNDFSAPSGLTTGSSGQAATLTSDGYQEIRMIADSTGFSPRTFLLKRGTPVRWVIDGQDLYGCNNAVRVQAFNIYQQLTQGTQTITFTPTASGTIPFSCGMGMIRGNFIVKDNIDLSDAGQVAAALKSAPAAPAGGSCGGTGGGCGCAAR